MKAFAIAMLLACVCAQSRAVAADGVLDTGFGADGIGWVGISDGDGRPSGCKPVVQDDGKIIICASRLSNGATGSDFLVARFNADGSLDAGFGAGGLITIDFDGGGGGDQANGIALQRDGAIVVAGTTYGIDAQSAKFAVARLTASGTLDASFAGGAGKTTISFQLGGMDVVGAVAIQPDARIVVAGSTQTPAGADVAIARLLTDGTLDTAFGSTGKVTFGFDLAGATAETDAAKGVAVDDDGRIVVAGTASESAPQIESEFGAARLLADGELDPGFHANGRATVAFDPGTGISTAYAFGVVIQRDGRILIPGYANTSASATQNMDIAAERLMADGSLDASFGTGGTLVIPFDLEPDGFDAGIDATEQLDGRLILVGTALDGNSQYAAVARVGSNGALDPTFGTFGRQTYDFGLTMPGTQAFTGVALQGTQIIVAGIAYVPPLGAPQALDCFVARLSNDSLFADGFD